MAVSAQSQTCRSCEHSRTCVRDAALFLSSLPDTFITRRERQAIVVTGKVLFGAPPPRGVDQGTRPTLARPRAPISQIEQALLNTLPKRVASQVRNMLQTGWFDFARAELHAGRNPAEKGWRHTFCAQLLEGGATRETLRLAFMTELKLTPESAKVQLSNAISIFAAGRIAVETSGGLQLVSKGVDRP